VQSFSSEADSRLDLKEVDSHLRNLKIHYRRRKDPSLGLRLRQFNPIHIFTYNYLEFRFNVILSFVLCFRSNMASKKPASLLPASC
jgi:hypothetical protein